MAATAPLLPSPRSREEGGPKGRMRGGATLSSSQTERRLDRLGTVAAVEGRHPVEPWGERVRVGLEPLGRGGVRLLAVVEDRAHDLVLHLQREDEVGQELAEVRALAPSAIIPGHGPVERDGSSLVQTRSYLDWLETTLNAAANEGLDMVEIMETRIPAQFAEMGAMPGEFIRSVSHLYPGIERSVLPLVNR